MQVGAAAVRAQAKQAGPTHVQVHAGHLEEAPAQGSEQLRRSQPLRDMQAAARGMQNCSSSADELTSNIGTWTAGSSHNRPAAPPT